MINAKRRRWKLRVEPVIVYSKGSQGVKCKAPGLWGNREQQGGGGASIPSDGKKVLKESKVVPWTDEWDAAQQSLRTSSFYNNAVIIYRKILEVVKKPYPAAAASYAR